MKKVAVRFLLGLWFPLVASLPLAGEPVSLPAGTILHLRNDTTISTEFSEERVLVRATVVQPFLYASQELIPVGSVLTGRVHHLKKPGRFTGRGELRIVFDQLELPSGETYSLQAVIVTIDNPEAGVEVTAEGSLRSTPTQKRDAVLLGAGAGTGAVVGGVAAGPAGALLGAGIGSGAMLARRGRQTHFDAELEFQAQLLAPLLLASGTTRY